MLAAKACPLVGVVPPLDPCAGPTFRGSLECCRRQKHNGGRFEDFICG
jgi:hypothetical protein